MAFSRGCPIAMVGRGHLLHSHARDAGAVGLEILGVPGSRSVHDCRVGFSDHLLRSLPSFRVHRFGSFGA